MTDTIKNWYKEIKQDNKNKVDSNFNKHHIFTIIYDIMYWRYWEWKNKCFIKFFK